MKGVFRRLGSGAGSMGKDHKKCKDDDPAVLPVVPGDDIGSSSPLHSSSLPRALERKLRLLVKTASLESEAGDWHKAEEAYSAAIALQPGDEELFRLRSEVLCKLGKLEEALADANKSLYLAPSSAEGMCCQAAALILQGRKEEAASVLSAAVRLHPHHTVAHRRLLELRGVHRYKSEDVAISSARFSCALRPCVADGKPCAARRLSKVSETELLEAAEILSRIKHPNVVKITGYCLQSRILIFENLCENTEVDPGLGWAARLEAASAVCKGVVHLQMHKQIPMKFRVLAPEDVVVTPRGKRKVIPTHVIRAYCRDLYHKDALGVVLLHLLGVESSRELLLELEQDYGTEFAFSSAANELILGAGGGPCWPRGVAQRAVRAAFLCVSKAWHLVEEALTEQTLKEFQLLENASKDEEWLKTIGDEAESDLLSPGSVGTSGLDSMHGSLIKSFSVSSGGSLILRRVKSQKRTPAVSLEELPPVPCLRYTPEEVEQATHGFSEASKLGEGEYGEAFSGNFQGRRAVVKRLYRCRREVEGFENELTSLTRFRHPNIIPLLGYCPEARCLVYEHVKGHPLQQRLSPPLCKDSPLSWVERARAAAQLTRALMYLHGSNPPIAHRDLKLQNIFVTDDGMCKISDFGLAKLVPKRKPARKGKGKSKSKIQLRDRDRDGAVEDIELERCQTFDSEVTGSGLGREEGCGLDEALLDAGLEEGRGYMDPEALVTGRKTRLSDVYALGLILLQLLTGLVDVEQVHDLLAEDGISPGTTGIMEAMDSPHGSPMSSPSSRLPTYPRTPSTEASPMVDVWSEKKASEVLKRLDDAAGAWPRDIAQDLARVAVRCTAREPALRPKLGKEVKAAVDAALKVATRQAPRERHERETRSSPKVQEALDQLLSSSIPPDMQIRLVKLLYNNPQRAETFLTLPKEARFQWLEGFLEVDSE